MRIAVTGPSRSPVLRKRRMASAFMESPVFTAIGIPARRCIVGAPRRESLPSSMSSCTRKALCSISRPAAAGNASSARPPSARAVAMHKAGRKPLPDRSMKSFTSPYRCRCGSQVGMPCRERVGEHVAIPAQALQEIPSGPTISPATPAPRRRCRATAMLAGDRRIGRAPHAVGSTVRTVARGPR